MTDQPGLLELPNEILRNLILLDIPRDELAWTGGLVCKRLMQITLDICNNTINIPSEPMELHRTTSCLLYTSDAADE